MIKFRATHIHNNKENIKLATSMASTLGLDIPAISQFDSTGDPSSLSQRWTDWTKRFKYYKVAVGIKDAAQKRALLLHLAGPATQDIFETLADTGADDDFNTALAKLTEYFNPKKNET